MVALDAQGKKVTVPGLILKSDTEIRRFAKSLARMRAEREREETFRAADFSSESYLEQIKECRVKIER
jgi:hypothetical protein